MPRPAAIDLAARFRRKLERQEAEVFRRMARLYSGIFQRVNDEVQALAEELSALEDASPRRLLGLSSVRRILARVRDEVAHFGIGTVQNSIVIVQEQAIDAALDEAIQLILASLPDLPAAAARSAAGALTVLPVDAILAAADLLGADSPLRESLEASYGKAVADQVAAHLFDGMVAGQNPRRIAGLLERNLQKSLGSGLSWALQTVRTAQIKSYQTANQMTYMANSNIVPTWVWWARLEAGRTCLSCINQHGSEHPVTERLNDHQSGRCVPLPKAISFADLGLRGVREQPVQVERGEDWFKRQSRGVQRQMMGQARYRAWQAKEIGFEEFSQRYEDPVYGELLREASLKGMLGRKAEEFYRN